MSHVSIETKPPTELSVKHDLIQSAAGCLVCMQRITMSTISLCVGAKVPHRDLFDGAVSDKQDVELACWFAPDQGGRLGTGGEAFEPACRQRTRYSWNLRIFGLQLPAAAQSLKLITCRDGAGRACPVFRGVARRCRPGPALQEVRNVLRSAALLRRGSCGLGNSWQQGSCLRGAGPCRDGVEGSLFLLQT